MYFHQNWVHYRGIKGTCHVCGQETHAGMSLRTGEYYWLHDGYRGMPDFYRSHGFKNLEKLDEEEFEKLMAEAEAKGIDPLPRPERGVGARRSRRRSIAAGRQAAIRSLKSKKPPMNSEYLWSTVIICI